MATPTQLQLGTSRVSKEQKAYLTRARTSPDVSEKARILHHVINDDEISSGEEDLLPDWIELFQEYKSGFAENLPLAIYTDLENTVGQLEPIDEAEEKLTFADLDGACLLGAEASKPPPSNIPTVMELLPELLTRARRLDRDDLNRLADFCERRKIDNIEDLLTAAQLATFTSRNPATQRLINFLLSGSGDDERPSSRPRYGDQAAIAFLQDTLQVLFGLLASTMLPAKPNAAHKAIANYAKKRGGVNIITTNYDCCMDLALGSVRYPFSYGLEFGDFGSQNAIKPTDTRLTPRQPKLVLLRNMPKGPAHRHQRDGQEFHERSRTLSRNRNLQGLRGPAARASRAAVGDEVRCCSTFDSAHRSCWGCFCKGKCDRCCWLL